MEALLRQLGLEATAPQVTAVVEAFLLSEETLKRAA
jgi:hypothetical protein